MKNKNSLLIFIFTTFLTVQLLSGQTNCCEAKNSSCGGVIKSKSDLFQLANEMEWEELGDGLSRQIMGYDKQIMSVKVGFEKGAIGEVHSHFHVQVSYIISGKFEITVGDKTTILTAGDGFYVAPNVLHGAVCLEEGYLLDIFTPCRADFLK